MFEVFEFELPFFSNSKLFGFLKFLLNFNVIITTVVGWLFPDVFSTIYLLFVPDVLFYNITNCEIASLPFDQFRFVTEHFTIDIHGGRVRFCAQVAASMLMVSGVWILLRAANCRLRVFELPTTKRRVFRVVSLRVFRTTNLEPVGSFWSYRIGRVPTP